jgi:fumarate hydratase class II
MPGKTNPTQCEALLMVCLQVTAAVFSYWLSISPGERAVGPKTQVCLRQT